MTPEATTAPVLDPCTEARRLRAEGATMQPIADALGVAVSTVHRWTQDIEVTVRRRCRMCRERFTASRSTGQSVCDACTQARAERVAAAKVEADERRATREAERDARETERRAEAERREAERRAKFCDVPSCGAKLLTPAKYCGFCIADGGALAREIDHNEERSAVTEHSTTHGGKP